MHIFTKSKTTLKCLWYWVIKPKLRFVRNNKTAIIGGVVVDLLAAHTGYTSDEMHEALKMKFLRITRPNLPDTVQSTARLTKDQFCEYIDNIQKWAATEMGCVIPDANQVFLT